MKDIIVGFSRPKKFAILSWIIRKVLKTEYSHVYIKFHSDSLERDLIYQASGLQINFVGTNLFDEHHETIKTYKLTICDTRYKKALQLMVDRAGLPYSIKQLILIFFYILTKKVLFKKDGRNYQICAEATGEIIEMPADLDLITPKDVDLWLNLNQSKI